MTLVLESRVRENRLHGSEGGAAHARPYPYQADPAQFRIQIYILGTKSMRH